MNHLITLDELADPLIKTDSWLEPRCLDPLVADDVVTLVGVSADGRLGGVKLRHMPTDRLAQLPFAKVRLSQPHVKGSPLIAS